jgi:hypothetical protein
MAITRQGGGSIRFTATNDGTTAAADLMEIRGMTFQGTGLTAAQRIVVTDGPGNVLSDYVIEAATDNADLWGSKPPKVVDRILVTNTTVDGTWVLTVFF